MPKFGPRPSYLLKCGRELVTTAGPDALFLVRDPSSGIYDEITLTDLAALIGTGGAFINPAQTQQLTPGPAFMVPMFGNLEHILRIDVTGGSSIGTLPPISTLSDGQWVKIKRNDGSANTLNLIPSGGDTIDSALIHRFDRYESFTFYADANRNEWNIT